LLKGRTSLMIAFMLAGLIVLLSCTGVFAGDGSGSGGGKGNPLSLVSANPADGQKDVSLSPEITLNFSKNVVNMSVKDNNQKCFTLNSADGTQIPVEVIMADDQIEPEKKDIIAVSPTVELSPDTQYILKILADLTSKNGTTLEKTVSITRKHRCFPCVRRSSKLDKRQWKQGHSHSFGDSGDFSCNSSIF